MSEGFERVRDAMPDRFASRAEVAEFGTRMTLQTIWMCLSPLI